MSVAGVPHVRRDAKIAVIIPALNEEESIGRVLEDIPDWVDEVIVADNGCTDRTPEIARARGAVVVTEPRRGYGSACLAAMRAMREPDIVVFLDGDYSDYPQEMNTLVDPILDGEVDLVVGSRVLGRRERGALTPQARFGNWLACALIRAFWGVCYTDLGPFRAIRTSTLLDLGMRDPDYGWTVEIQVRAAQQGARSMEVPVRYRRRIGRSKVSGTVRGTIGAGTKILGVIFAMAVQRRPRAHRPVSPHRRIIVFTRYPVPGRTKTRLIPALGPEGAAKLHRKMTQQAVETVQAFVTGDAACSAEIRYAGGSETEMRSWLGNDPILRPQGDGDLGRRMGNAARTAFAEGAARVVIIGTDCPRLGRRHLEEAFRSLETTDIVFGPARDGGYYLVGLGRPLPVIFHNVAWGTGRVLAESLSHARGAGHSVHLLEELADVDRPEDLASGGEVPGDDSQGSPARWGTPP